MLRRRCTLLVALASTTWVGVTRADATPRLMASWKERGARVVAFSPDGRSLVSSGAEGFRLRDAETGRVRAVLAAPPHQLEGTQFSPDGRLLFAKVNSDEYKPVPVFDLKAWDVVTGRTRATIPYVAEGINASTDHFALSRDGTMLATLDNSERLPMQVKAGKAVIDGRFELDYSVNTSTGLPRIKLWNVPEWKETMALDGGSHMVFSPDGTTLATGSRDWRTPVARIWDTATGDHRADLVGKAKWVKPMAFSPDGKFLAIGGTGDQTLWELASGRKWEVPVKLLGNQGPEFSPDGALLFPNGLPRGYPAYNMNQEFPCYAVTAPPPRRLELGEGKLVVQPLTYNEARLLISLAAMRYVVFSEADQRGRRTVVARDLPDRRVLGTFAVTGLEDAGFSPDGRWLALLGGRSEVAPAGVETQSGTAIQLLDPTTGRVLVTVPSPSQIWGRCGWMFSPDGNSLAVYYRTGSNISRPGDPDPSDRPMNVEIWGLPPR